jgi:hypothetical protein
MRSLRFQFLFFAVLLVTVVAGGGWLNYQYMKEADEA